MATPTKQEAASVESTTKQKANNADAAQPKPETTAPTPSTASKTKSEDAKATSKPTKKRRLEGQHDGERKRRRLCSESDLCDSKNVILCSTEKFKERQCGRHLELIFSEAIEEMIGAQKKKAENEKSAEEKSDEKSEPENSDIAKGISADISAALSGDEKLCEWIEGPGGLVVVEILTRAVKASDVLAFVFERSYPERPSLSPFVFKLFPLDETSRSRAEEMIALGERMISATEWNDVDDDAPYAINYKNRGNKKLDRNEIVKGIAAKMPDRFKVNLRQPKTVLLLQTFGRTAGLSIIKHGVFDRHRQFNLTKFD